MRGRAAIATLVVTALTSATTRLARADDQSTQAAMESYFDGEKCGGLILGAMGLAGGGAGVLLLTRDSDLARGAGYATAAIGVVHLAAGVFVFVASDARLKKFRGEIDADGAAFSAREATRVRGVIGQFTALKIVEVVLIGAGGGAFAFGLASDRDLVAGIGVGVAVEAAATLVFDIVASRRAARYLGALKLAPLADGTAATLTWHF